VSSPVLQRFKDAQARTEDGYSPALAEIRSGGKRGHWIWYIFPQLTGLGRSPQSTFYGISGVEEAMAYLRDPLLRARLAAAVAAVAERQRTGQSLSSVMGSRIDALKLISSLTLFGSVAATLDATEADEVNRDVAETIEAVLEAAESEGYRRCSFTLDRLAAASRPKPE
jgi:uncharacterized protein (DUF1810 family)